MMPNTAANTTVTAAAATTTATKGPISSSRALTTAKAHVMTADTASDTSKHATHETSHHNAPVAVASVVQVCMVLPEQRGRYA